MIPTHLRATLGRAEITRSLRTQDRREALRRLRVWEGHVERLLTLLSRWGARMTREEIDRLVEEYTAKTFDEIEEALSLEWERPGLDQYSWDLNDRAHEISGALSDADPRPAMELARQMAPGAPEGILRRLARRLMEVQLLGVTETLRALNGEPLRRPHVPLQVQLATPAVPKGRLQISDLTRQYGDERVARKNWTARTEFQIRGYLTLLCDLLGNPPIGDVTKDDMRRLGLDLTRLPSNLTKRFPGKTPREALDAAENDDAIPRLAAHSVNAYTQAIRSFFLWAMEHDHIAHNPAVVLKSMETRKASEDRYPFDDDDLRTYFKKLDSKRDQLPVEYWVPRIMAFTGCRLAEAAQLCKHDIRMERGIWVIDINEVEDDKTLKTNGSKRLVPMHHRLVELGLPELVSSYPHGYLWPQDMRTNPNPKGSRVDKLQKRLAHVLRSSGIKDRKKTAAHSFRHTLSSRLKALSVPEYQISEILGHELDSITTGRYGSVTDIGALKTAIDRLVLPI